MKNHLLTGDSGVNGIYRCKLIVGEEPTDIRVYIPGISSINPYNPDGSLNSEAYNNHKESFPLVQWCCYNIESKEYDNQDSLCWCMFENGDFRKPVVISYAIIGGGGTSSSNNGQFNGPSNTSNMYNLVDGEIHDAIFTAYYATADDYSTEENKLQGGPIAANGEVLDYTKRTCAAPPEIAFNTNIKVLDTGTTEDGNIYRVNDRGGAIKIENGVYHFDLLMKDKDAAYGFGKQTGKVMIGGTLKLRYQLDEDASEVAKNAVILACAIADDNSHGYVYGGKGPTNFDCSGFVWYCYNNSQGGNLSSLSYAATGSMKSTYQNVGFEDITAGIDLPTGTGLITGDILINISGGHVDMYAGNGKRVGAHSSSTGIYVDNYGYNQSGYNNKYDCVLRYKG